MNEIENLLDQIDEKKEAKKKELDQFHDQVTRFFGDIVIPVLKETKESLLKRGYQCDVVEEISDDAHFRYLEVALEMYQDKVLKSMITFAPDAAKGEIAISLIMNRDDIDKTSSPLAELDKEQVLKKVALFLERYLDN